MWNGPAGGTTAPTGYMRKSFNKIPFSLIKWPKGIYSEGAKTMGCQERGFPAAAGDGEDYREHQEAEAVLIGGPLAPRINGMVRFKDVPGGVEVFVHVEGLPPYQPAREGRPPVGPHGFHIHEKGDCTVGDPANPFTAAGPHWNPDHQPHGNHAGDFPVLFSNCGLATMTFFTNRFKVAEIVGRSVIIHENPDDYRTQPNGAAGRRLACGGIKRKE